MMQTQLLTEADILDAIEFDTSNYTRDQRRHAYRRRGFEAMVYPRRMPSRNACRQWLLDNVQAGGWKAYMTLDQIEFAFRDRRDAVAFKMRWG